MVCSRKKTPTRGLRTTETAPRLCSLPAVHQDTSACLFLSLSLSVLAVGTSSLSLSCHRACGGHSLRLWLPGCCPHSEQSTVPRSCIFRSRVSMPLLGGIHTTERAAGRAGILDRPTSGAMAVPSSAFSGLAGSEYGHRSAPGGRSDKPGTLLWAQGHLCRTEWPPTAQLCQSDPLAPRTICLPLGDLTPAKLTARSIPLGPGTVSVPLGHITLPEPTARSVPLGPGTSSVPTEWPHRRALGHCSQAR